MIAKSKKEILISFLLSLMLFKPANKILSQSQTEQHQKVDTNKDVKDRLDKKAEFIINYLKHNNIPKQKRCIRVKKDSIPN